MRRTSRFDFALGLDADLAYQWDTKRKLFSLAEVYALLNAVKSYIFVFPAERTWSATNPLLVKQATPLPAFVGEQ